MPCEPGGQYQSACCVAGLAPELEGRVPFGVRDDPEYGARSCVCTRVKTNDRSVVGVRSLEFNGHNVVVTDDAGKAAATNIVAALEKGGHEIGDATGL